LQIETVFDEGLAIVSVAGKIDAITSTAFEKALGELIDGGHGRMILDLGDVDYVSSAGLRVLLMAAKRVHGRGALVLTRLQPGVREIVTLTGFDNVLPIEAEPEAARAKLRGE